MIKRNPKSEWRRSQPYRCDWKKCPGVSGLRATREICLGKDCALRFVGTPRHKVLRSTMLTRSTLCLPRSHRKDEAT